MNWWIVTKKTAKHALISGSAAAVAIIQSVPAGTEIDWERIALSAVVAALTGGSAGGALNVVKHSGR